MEEIQFSQGSVPIAVVARIYGKDASWIRAGIIAGWLPIGKATRDGKLVTKVSDINSKYHSHSIIFEQCDLHLAGRSKSKYTFEKTRR